KQRRAAAVVVNTQAPNYRARARAGDTAAAHGRPTDAIPAGDIRGRYAADACETAGDIQLWTADAVVKNRERFGRRTGPIGNSAPYVGPHCPIPLGEDSCGRNASRHRTRHRDVQRRTGEPVVIGDHVPYAAEPALQVGHSGSDPRPGLPVPASDRAAARD